MRRHVLVASAAVAAITTLPLAGPAPPSGQAAVPRSCAAAGSRVLAASGLTRVYRTSNRTFACRPQQRRVLLGFATDPQDPRTDLDIVVRPRAAGRYVAYELAYRDEMDHRNTVVVRNAATRRTVTSAPTGTLINPDGPDSGIGPTTALALRGDGAVAWIVADVENSTGQNLEVWAARGQKRERLAVGPDIAPRELRIRDGRVVWAQAGAPRTASLPGG
jgi:hypothetical protein